MSRSWQDKIGSKPWDNAAGSILVKVNNPFSKDYEALAQGTSGQGGHDLPRLGH